MNRSRLVAIDHVELEVPANLIDELRWFYSEVGRLDEIVEAGSAGTLMGFRSARLELRLHVVEHPKVDSVPRRLTLLVPSLFEAIRQLDERGVIHFPVSGFTFTDRRVATLDPAGHRVELKQEWPEAPL